MSEVVIVAAVGRNRGIGFQNRLPWYLPDDLKRFKTLTLGSPVIMGRNTWRSLGRSLPGRQNVVVSQTLAKAALPPEVTLVPSLADALAITGSAPTVFVIGGAALYAEALPIANRLELTEVDAAPPADAFFPPLLAGAFTETSRIFHPADDQHAHPFWFVTYRRASRTQST